MENTLLFFDTLIIKEKNETLQTAVYQKESNTRLTINPSSNQDPTIWKEMFKGALCHAYRICSTESF